MGFVESFVRKPLAVFRLRLKKGERNFFIDFVLAQWVVTSVQLFGFKTDLCILVMISLDPIVDCLHFCISFHWGPTL